MIIQAKKYSWLSYTAFILGILLAALPVIYALVPIPFDLIFALYTGIIIVITLSLIALLKRSEKKFLAIFSLVLALLLLGFVRLLLSLTDCFLYFVL
jgi:hypothetical protein